MILMIDLFMIKLYSLRCTNNENLKNTEGILARECDIDAIVSL